MKKLLILCVFLGVSLMAKSFELVKEPVLTTQMVEGILELAKKEARKNDFYVSITIVDKSGQILAVLRDDKAGCIHLMLVIKKLIRPLHKKEKQRLFLKV